MQQGGCFLPWRRTALSLALAASCAWCIIVVQRVYSQEQGPPAMQEKALPARVSGELSPAAGRALPANRPEPQKAPA